MRKVLTRALALAAIGVVVLAVPNAIAGNASGGGAQKRQLVSRATTSDCAQGPATNSNSAQPNGFVIFNSNGAPGSAQDIIVEISLKNGQPNMAYMVFLESDGNPDCDMSPDGTLMTNAQGNGNLHLEQAEAAPTNSYWVVLKGVDEYATAPATVD